jgi:hypothetical protein
MYALTWVADFHMLSLIHMLTHCALVNIRAWYHKSQYKLMSFKESLYLSSCN